MKRIRGVLLFLLAFMLMGAVASANDITLKDVMVTRCFGAKFYDATVAEITWTEANTDSYKIEISTKKNRGFRVVERGGTPGIGIEETESQASFQLRKLKRGYTYYIRVTLYLTTEQGIQRKSKTVKYAIRPDVVRLKTKKEGSKYRLYWTASNGKSDLEKGLSGIEIYRNGKLYRSREGNNISSKLSFLASSADAQAGTKFKIRTYFKKGRKKIYSRWSNVIVIK